MTIKTKKVRNAQPITTIQSLSDFITIYGSTTGFFKMSIANFLNYVNCVTSHPELTDKNAESDFQHLTQTEKDAAPRYKEVIVTAASGTITLQAGTITRIIGALTSAHTLTITLGTETSGYQNDYVLEFTTGATLPVLTLPTRDNNLTAYTAPVASSRYQFIYTRKYNGTAYKTDFIGIKYNSYVSD